MGNVGLDGPCDACQPSLSKCERKTLFLGAPLCYPPTNRPQGTAEFHKMVLSVTQRSSLVFLLEDTYREAEGGLLPCDSQTGHGLPGLEPSLTIAGFFLHKLCAPWEAPLYLPAVCLPLELPPDISIHGKPYWSWDWVSPPENFSAPL